MRQKSLIEVVLKKFEVYTKEKYPKATVFPVGEKLEEATDNEFEEAKGLPYKSLLASLGYVCVWTKPEYMFAYSSLGKFMAKWSKRHFDLAVSMLLMMHQDREFGVITVQKIHLV